MENKKIDKRVRYTPEQKEEMRRRYKLYLENRPTEICKDFNVSTIMLSRIVNPEYNALVNKRNSLAALERQRRRVEEKIKANEEFIKTHEETLRTKN